MLQRNIASRYAGALFNLAREKGELEAIESSFPPIAQVVEQDEDLNGFLTHPAIASAEKKEVINKLFQGKINDMLYDFLCMVVDKKREAYIPLMWDVFNDLLLEHRKQLIAEVTTPYELPGGMQNELREKLKKVTGKDIIIEQIVQPEMLGGICVRLGDRIIDGSVGHRLEKLKEALKGVKV